MHDSQKAWDAQKAYCERTKAPLFASQRCFSCGQDIFAPEGKAKSGPLGRQWFTGKTKAGISIEEAESTLVTGCPFCNASYCD